MYGIDSGNGYVYGEDESVAEDRIDKAKETEEPATGEDAGVSSNG